MDVFLIIIGAILTNNILLTTFFGLCPFVGVSGEYQAAAGMGMAVIFVLTLTAPINWLIEHFLLQPLGVEYLRFITFIITIAFLVQIVEMFVARFSPTLYNALGIYLPLITVNCAIFGTSLFMVFWNLNFLQSAGFGFGAGVGWSLAILAMAAIRERLRFAPIPSGFEGPAITLIIAGLMALGFAGFSGMINIQALGG
ncbi:MAG: electron transport complex protein RnfA [Candidatus Bipolaricaulia bacterium]